MSRCLLSRLASRQLAGGAPSLKLRPELVDQADQLAPQRPAGGLGRGIGRQQSAELVLTITHGIQVAPQARPDQFAAGRVALQAQAAAVPQSCRKFRERGAELEAYVLVAYRAVVFGQAGAVIQRSGEDPDGDRRMLESLHHGPQLGPDLG